MVSFFFFFCILSYHSLEFFGSFICIDPSSLSPVCIELVLATQNCRFDCNQIDYYYYILLLKLVYRHICGSHILRFGTNDMGRMAEWKANKMKHV